MNVVELPEEFCREMYAESDSWFRVPINEDVAIVIKKRFAHRMVKLARVDPARRHEETLTVDVPITWLTGERVGY